MNVHPRRPQRALRLWSPLPLPLLLIMNADSAEERKEKEGRMDGMNE